MRPPPDSRAWIDVSATALRANLRQVVEAVGPDPWVVPMVKADGYGLGALDVVRALQPLAPAAWGVASVDEGIALRDGGVVGPIIVFSPTPRQTLRAAVEFDLALAVSDLDALEALIRAAERRGRRARVHVEVDTGMGRAGFPAEAIDVWGSRAGALLRAEAVRWEGLYTHFHSADEVGGPGVDDQLATFGAVVEALDPPPDVRLHTANSAAAFRLGGDAGGARPGIFVYGGGAGRDLPAPRPVASVRARVVRVVDVEPGATVGYGATHRAEREERWATLAIGYGDGLPRALGNRGHALLAGRKVPLVGRISMDLTVANISGIDGVQPGNVATLVGRDGVDEITIDEVAAQAGTISYEVLTGLTTRLPRIWTELD
ncbi:MAG: alanine racemase [Gemmatimonadetes bacterium]|nr:alanine racemase [Gemmatimonadota bacterium]